jgi:hypothetical protein
MTRNEFNRVVVNEINKAGFKCSSSGKKVNFIKDNKTHSADLDVLYKGYCESTSFETFIFMLKLNILYNLFAPFNTKTIYPIIMNDTKYNKTGLEDIIYQPLTCDLHISFMDASMGEYGAWVTNCGLAKNIDIKKDAFENLDNIVKSLHKLFEKIDFHSEIYGVHCSFFAPSFIFNKIYRDKIIEQVGSEFIFTFPTEESLIFSQNTEENIENFKSFLNLNSYNDRLFSNIYLYKAGEYTML